MGMKIVIEIFVSLKKDSKTRGHKITLVKDQCRLDIRKYSFRINEWIKLQACPQGLEKGIREFILDMAAG